jgi:hypothetical protein
MLSHVRAPARRRHNYRKPVKLADVTLTVFQHLFGDVGVIRCPEHARFVLAARFLAQARTASRGSAT